MISKTKIDSIVKKIIINFNPEKIFLFGSYAAGMANEDSDLDLLIIEETDKPRRLRNIDVRKSLIGNMIPIDIMVYTPKEFEAEKAIKFSFINNAIKTSKILYERK